MGPEATLLMFQRILENTAATRDQDHARIIIENNPKIPERLPAILGTGENPVPMMVQSGLALEKAGADFIIIPCVSAHFFLPDLRRKLGLPILSMLEETAAAIEAYRPKILKAGLMAAVGPIQTGLFYGILQKAGMETLVSEEDDLQRVQTAIFHVKDTKGGHDRRGLKKGMKEIGDRLIQKGAQAIVVGCTELSILIHPDDFGVPVFDALTILARSAVKRAGLKAT